MKRIKQLIYNLALIIFLNHGILYFWCVDDLYNYDNPIKLIKYIILIITLVLSMSAMHKSTMKKYLVIGLFCVISHFIAVNNADVVVLLNYLIPFSTIMIFPILEKYINKKTCIVVTYIITSLVAYVEFLFLRGTFTMFADMGYRVVSIFINPNALAFMTWIMSVYIVFNVQKLWIKIFVLSNSFFIVFLSGSRMVLIVLGILFIMLTGYSLINCSRNRWKLKKNDMMLLFGISSVSVIVAILMSNQIFNFVTEILSKTRSLGNIDFTIGRFQQFSNFFLNVKRNFIFPNELTYVYTDNLYLHMWGFFGLPIVILFIVFNIYILIKIYKNKNWLLFFLITLFLINGMTENFLYLWPIGYIYWYSVCVALKRQSEKY